MPTSTTKYGIEKVEEAPLRAPTPSATPSQFEIDVQIRTAREFARDEKKALQKCKDLIFDPDMASVLTYRVERGGEIIEGPSSALAELMTYSWGNIRVAGDWTVGETHVTAEAVAIDLQGNTAYRTTVKKRILDRNNRRFPESLIELVGRAAESLAMRNATFKIIPRPFTRQIMVHAKTVAAKGAVSNSWPTLVSAFEELKVSEKQVLSFLKKTVEEVDHQDVARLRGIYAAIKDGDATADEVFKAPERERKQKSAEKVTGKAKAGPPRTQPHPPAEPEPSGEDQGGALSEGPEAAADLPTEADCLEMLLDRFGREDTDRLWPIVKKAFADLTPQDFLARVEAIVASPPQLVVASLSDAEPVRYIVEITETAMRMRGVSGQSK